MKCSYRLTSWGPRYYVDGREVDEAEYDRARAQELREERAREKQNGRRFRAPLTRGDITDWSKENGGRGRYCPQLGRYQKDPRAYARSKREAINKARQLGMKAEDTRPQL